MDYDVLGCLWVVAIRLVFWNGWTLNAVVSFLVSAVSKVVLLSLMQGCHFLSFFLSFLIGLMLLHLIKETQHEQSKHSCVPAVRQTSYWEANARIIVIVQYYLDPTRFEEDAEQPLLLWIIRKQLSYFGFRIISLLLFLLMISTSAHPATSPWCTLVWSVLPECCFCAMPFSSVHKASDICVHVCAFFWTLCAF